MASLQEVRIWHDGCQRRTRILEGLEIVLPEIRECFAEHAFAPPPLVLAGSYFSDKPDPQDIEVTFFVSEFVPDPIKVQCIMTHIRNHDRWKTEHLVDCYPSLPNCRDFRSYFQYVGVKTALAKGLAPFDLRGVVKVELW